MNVYGGEKGDFSLFFFPSAQQLLTVGHNSLANQLVVINSLLSVAKHAGRAGLTRCSVPVGSVEMEGDRHISHGAHKTLTYSRTFGLDDG